VSFYEGWLYGTVMARFQTGLNAFICKQIDAEARVLEAGCGTGNLTRPLSRRVREIVAVDSSASMIEFARGRARDGAMSNVTFVHGDVTKVMGDHPDDDFDLALMVLVLHEMPQSVREAALGELARLGKRVLIVDFKVPQPRNLAGFRNRSFERLAGREHHAAFVDYCRRGGAGPIARELGLHCEALRDVDARSLTLWSLAQA
jgi:ubiquinone/menaquinone biosynthesis C-methylase UbiE